MTMPTLDDLRMTFEEAYSKANFSAHSNNVLEGLRAVLDALKPVVAEAYVAGGNGVYTGAKMPNENDYAARIIAQLKGESRE